MIEISTKMIEAVTFLVELVILVWLSGLNALLKLSNSTRFLPDSPENRVPRGTRFRPSELQVTRTRCASGRTMRQKDSAVCQGTTLVGRKCLKIKGGPQPLQGWAWLDTLRIRHFALARSPQRSQRRIVRRLFKNDRVVALTQCAFHGPPDARDMCKNAARH